ncbi:hypothetical protein AAHA92_30238 [Salvia divinorum]|uniref:Uncharacterized protein n=1 Tax=Salvia divinorum TaxID=28513 RepID=A0ABD1G438_SALDI
MRKANDPQSRMVGAKLPYYEKSVVRRSKPAAGTCSRCRHGATVAEMKTSTRNILYSTKFLLDFSPFTDVLL